MAHPLALSLLVLGLSVTPVLAASKTLIQALLLPPVGRRYVITVLLVTRLLW